MVSERTGSWFALDPGVEMGFIDEVVALRETEVAAACRWR